MNEDMIDFIIKLGVIGLVLAVGNFLLGVYIPSAVTPVWPWLLIFFCLTNSFLFWLFNRAKQKKLSSFTNYFMIATFSKLIAYLAVILVYVLFNRGDAVPFILTFFVYYIVFTAFEVITIAKQKLG
jgi:predicted neutral ceramidase superfamily lipid hydrolase